VRQGNSIFVKLYARNGVRIRQKVRIDAGAIAVAVVVLNLEYLRQGLRAAEQSAEEAAERKSWSHPSRAQQQQSHYPEVGSDGGKAKMVA
jgi:hypothetical protein